MLPWPTLSAASSGACKTSLSSRQTLSWPIGEGPGLGEQPVQVVQDIDLKKFEALALELLSRPASKK